MSILGSLGSFYMLILVLLIIIGFGLVGLWLINFIFSPKNKKQTNSVSTQGGSKMNRWLRLAVFSFVGIIVSMAILSFMTPGGMASGHNANMYGMPNQQMQLGGSSSSGMSGMSGGGMGMMMPMGNMQQGGGMGMMNMMPMGNSQQSGGMGMMMPMNNMQQGGGMGMMMPMGNMQQGSGMGTMNMTPMNNSNMIMQQLQQMQMQINQMQQQMMNNQSGGGGSMSGGGGMSMM